jgi:hypothetical protein
MGNFAQNAMMSSLAGVVNRTTNGEVMLSPDNGNQPNPRFWLDQLKASYPSVTSQVQSDPSFFISKYKSKISGYVLYDTGSNPDSLNIATSIAGVTNSIIVDSSTRLTAILNGLPQVADARSMTYASAYSTYANQFNKDMLFHQALYFDHHLRDFAVMNKGFVYYSSPTQLNPYASNQNHQGRIFGWADSEVDVFAQASQNNQQVVASNYSWSTSTMAKWKVPIAQQKSHAAGNVATKAGKHYVAFVMSDGDNSQWLTNAFATDPKWYGSPNRGKFNMTWDFSPSLKDMSPIAHNYIYEHASDGTYKDNFVAAGGNGTQFPSIYPDINGLASDVASSMASADLKVVSILDPNYSTSKLFPILDQEQVSGIMYKTYDHYYKGNNGKLEWHNGKPVLSVKYSLWDGADTAVSLASALNNQVHKDPLDDQASYSIVNVHPWSTAGPDGTGSGDPMSNLMALVNALDPNKVEVVTLEEMMVQLRNHFGLPVAGAQVTGTWKVNSSSDWSLRTNWSGAAPNFVDATVNFGSAITLERIVTVSNPVTAGTINFNNSKTYNVNGSGTINLDVTSGSAAINVSAGVHNIAAPLALKDDTAITVTPAASTLNVTNLQPMTVKLTKAGAGTLAVNRVRAREVNVAGGTLRVNTSGALASMMLVDALSVDRSAALDLTNNDLVVNAGDFSALQALVMLGYADATDGTKRGIISSTGQVAAGHPILALFDNALVGATDFPFGSGQTLGARAVAGKYTYIGDADFNGMVTPDDYGAVDSNLGAADLAAGSAWFAGDWNFDLSITPDDYLAIDANLGLGESNPLSAVGLAAMGAAAVPEPSGVVLLLMVAAHVIAHRRLGY